MSNLSLTTAEFERLLKVFGYLLGLLSFLFFLGQWKCLNMPVSSAVWRAFSLALGFELLLFGIFSKVAWRWKHLAKWMSRPIVHGVWKGELRSDFGKVDGNRLIIPIYFVIRQTYLTISVQSFTEQQEGESRLEALLKSSKTDVARLCYVFELRKLFPGASSVTSGAGELRLAGDQLTLRGTYWTNTPTHGELYLQLLSRSCEDITSLQDIQKIFP